MNVMELLGTFGVIPVVKIDNAEKAPALAEALLQGGLPCAEITFRTDAAEEAIRMISKVQPQVVVGAGTVLSVVQAQKAILAGARFIVSPGFDAKVVDWCLMQSVPIMPGVATSTEILMAIDKGLSILKFFPAEASHGITMLEALSAVFNGIKFVPTGGITASNMTAYLKLPAVHAIAGSWMVKSMLISSSAFGEIARLTSEAVTIARNARANAGAS